MILKKIRDSFHYIITLFLFFGGIWHNNCNVLKIHAFVCSMTILHWITNDNKCFLSEYDYNEENGYSIHLLKYLGIHLEQDKDQMLLQLISYSSVLIPLLFTFNKLLKC